MKHLETPKPLTVKLLIEALQKLPEDCENQEVFICCDEPIFANCVGVESHDGYVALCQDDE